MRDDLRRMLSADDPNGMTAQPVDPASPSPPAPRRALAAVRPGAIVLARHGEPALSRKCLINAAQYRDWWAKYEVLGLRAGQTPPPALLATAQGAGAIYASTRPRAIETANAVSSGREVLVDALFVEAPLPPPRLPDWFRLSPRFWGVVSRFHWHWVHSHGHETRAQAEARAEQAAQALIARAESGQDVLVLAHGYFNHMVGRRLRADGWRLVKDQGFKYWSQRRFERR